MQAIPEMWPQNPGFSYHMPMRTVLIGTNRPALEACMAHLRKAPTFYEVT
jgi:hypothetical protein